MKEKIKILKNIYNNPRGKACLFFSFYLVFFLIMIVILRFSSRSMNLSSNDYERGSNQKYNISKLLDSNFDFEYNVNLDGVNYKYFGQKNGDSELFSYNDKSYYKNKESFFVYDSFWMKNESPYLYGYFMDFKNITYLLDNASFEAKTEYDSGKVVYNYVISTNTINEFIHDVYSDFADEGNRISVSTNDNKEVNGITYDLSNYCLLNNMCSSSLKISLNYDNVGLVNDIVSPLI